MIEIRGLSKTFDGKLALRGVSLGIRPGERVALVGHNGSGKTTLVRCLLGLHNYEGVVSIDGEEVGTDRVTSLQRIAFVPQSPPALRFTVTEYLEFLRAVCGVEPAAVIGVAATLGLDVGECRRRPFRKLSGGMKQKLLVAAALARRPALLVMDEPTANLDPAARGAFFALLAGLPSETALLLTSHRVDELAGLVTRLVELDEGAVSRDEVVSPLTPGESVADRMLCRVVVAKDAAPSVTRGLAAWGLTGGAAPDARDTWEGQVGAPDRFRLLADLSRWAGALRSVELSEARRSDTEGGLPS
jgi:ABC-2 type transport system ATP-binding protein